MNVKVIATVLKKEIRDIVRDKKTLLTAFALPLVLFPVLFTVLGFSLRSMEASMENTRVAFSQQVPAATQAHILQEIFSQAPGIRVLTDLADPFEELRQEQVDVLIDLPPDTSAQGHPLEVTLVFDENKTSSAAGASNIMSLFEAYNNDIVAQKLKEQNIDLGALAPFQVSRQEVAEYSEAMGIEVPKSSGNYMLSMLIPLLVTMMVAAGGIPAATDLMAGEKERQTLEPLLSTRADRSSILTGKYITVVLFSLCSLICTIVGMGIAMKISPNSMLTMNAQGEASAAGLSLPLGSAILAFLVTLLTGMLFAAVELGLSAFARTYKEAQTWLSFVNIAVLLPGYVVMMMQAGDFSVGMMLIPVVGSMATLKMALAGYMPTAHIAAALASTLVYLVVVLFAASRLLNREETLLRS